MSGLPRHVTDEELSDLVDGAAAGDALAHVEDCSVCETRLARWKAVAGALAGGVEVPAGAREGAVGAAMGVLGALESSDGGAVGSSASSVSSASSASSDEGDAGIGPVSPGGARGGTGFTGRRWRVLSGLAAAAAVVVAAGVGLSQMHTGSGSSKASSGAASATTGAASASGGAPSRSSGAAQAEGLPVYPLADLGTLSGPPALVAAVKRTLAVQEGPNASSTPPAAANSSSGPTTAPATAPTSGTADGGVAGGGGRVTVLNGGATGSGSGTTNGVAAAPTPGGCQAAQSLFGAGAHPQLLLQATATYQKVPAMVFVYQVGSQRSAVVLAVGTCKVLARAAV